jgi:RHS repeat-associated protein
VKGRHDFLPYGEEVDVAIGSRNTVPGYSATDSLRQKFTAKERDLETGFDFFKARYYASKYGRFTSIDPLDASAKQTEPDTWNRYVYVTNNPLRFIDQDGQIKKDSNGKYVERVIGDKKYTHDGAPRVDFESTEVRLQTDDGQREIEAKRRPGASFDNNTGTLNINEKRTSADCHGLTFTEGKYWINDNQVQTILDHDNYKALGSGDKAVVGDVAVYRNASGGVVHSATVTQVDSRGQPTKVEGVGGLAMDSKATTPATQFATTDQAVAAGLPASAGYASVTYYHKQGESARDREKRVQAVTNFTKR